MATEDLTTFTEVDPDSKYSQTSTRNSWDTLVDNTSAYVYKDYGAGHFGDFEHLIDIKKTNDSGGGAWTAFYGCGSEYGSYDMLTDVIMFESYNDAGAYLYRLFDRVNVSSDSYAGSIDTAYYATVKRVGTTGTCKIYSDAGRTNLLDTLSITVTNTAFRYIQVGFTEGPGSPAGQWTTGYSENLDLQESPAPSGSDFIPNYFESSFIN